MLVRRQFARISPVLIFRVTIGEHAMGVHHAPSRGLPELSTLRVGVRPPFRPSSFQPELSRWLPKKERIPRLRGGAPRASSGRSCPVLDDLRDVVSAEVYLSGSRWSHCNNRPLTPSIYR